MFQFLNRKQNKGNSEIWIVAGLGNPGPEYAQTRHNCGFRVIDVLKEKIAPEGKEQQKFKGKYVSCEYHQKKVILLKPETYMNNSGECVQAAMHWFKTAESHLIVIYDDFDIPLGQIRVRQKGSAGTHNGMKSVLQYTNTDEFPRVRVGIGQKNQERDVIQFVLGGFTKEESAVLEKSFVRAADAALDIMDHGAANTMNRFNSNI